jgi:hypothetical protein
MVPENGAYNIVADEIYLPSSALLDLTLLWLQPIHF